MDPIVVAIGLAESFAVLAGALMLAKRRSRDRDLPRIAVLSAGIFVAQMINFPVGGGTTGHLIGGALFAILAGPVIAIVGMTAVLLIQALMFGDGGITALGLNALNMAVIAPLTGWGVYTLARSLLRQANRVRVPMAIGMGAWASVFLAAAACAAELAVSFAISGGTYGIAANISVPAMLGYHAVIGFGEAVITCGILAYITAVSPDLLERGLDLPVSERGATSFLRSKTAHATMAILIVLAAALPFYFLFASQGKDGLEQTVATSGVDEGNSYLAAPFSYGETYLTALLAGIAGFLLVSLVMLILMKLVERRRSEV